MLTNRRQRLGALALLATATIGALHVPFPFTGDQALFTAGAMKLHHGGVLYVDFWDIKQPGIYAFYGIAGALLGFSELGIHAFELLYWLAFAVVLMLTLRDRFSNPWIVGALPLLTVGMYYSAAGAWHLTQVEALASFPLYLTLWFALESSRSINSRTSLLFYSGVTAGVALLFKLLFLPIVVAFWAVAFFAIRKREKHYDVLPIVGEVAAISCGLAVPMAITLVFFGYHHALSPLLQTTFIIPLRVFGQVPGQNVHRLISDFQWFTWAFLPVIVLGIIGITASIKSASDALPAGLVAWMGIGLGIILVQHQFWWQYHFMLLFVPIGVLAAYGLDALVNAMLRYRRLQTPLARLLTLVAVALLFFPPLRSIAGTLHALERNNFAIGTHGKLGFYEAENSEYGQVLRDSAFLAEPNIRRGDIFVIGNSLRYTLTGRSPAIALHAWAPASLLPEQWQEMTRELQHARPPYVYLHAAYADIIRRRSPETLRFLQANYQILSSDSAGTWYRLSR